MTQQQVIDRLRAACTAAGSQRQWALTHGLSTVYVNDVVNGKRPPGPSILKALGLTALPQEIRYKEENKTK